MRLLLTYATPYNGAQISTIGRKVIQNSALADMFPTDADNEFLNSLGTRWKQYRIAEKRPVFVKCAYETVPLPGVGLVVPKSSGDALCDGPSDPIAEDHIGITKPTSINHDSVKVLVNALRTVANSKREQTPSPASTSRVLLEDIDTSKISGDALFIANKVHRNLAELLGDAGQQVVAPPTSVAAGPLVFVRVFSLSFNTSGDRLTAELTVKSGDGVRLAATDISGRAFEIKELYKVVPAALMYGADIDETSLKKMNTARKPTENNLAYAYYLYSWRQVQTGDLEGAEHSLLRAVALDSRFAMGYWALAELKRKSGAKPEANAYSARARTIDPDHRQIVVASAGAQENPVGAVMASIRAAAWQRLDSGLLYRQARTASYGIEVRSWKVDPKSLKITFAEQKSAFGSAVTEHLVDPSTVFALSGGFFNKDQEKRLSPAGILVTNGIIRNSLLNSQSGALVVDKQNSVDIVWAKDLRPLPGYLNVVQSEPILVEDAGKMGIRKDDFDRLNRSAVCLTGGHVVFIDVHGAQNKGLSLFQLATILRSREEDGGFSCARALNLDGGPSTQAAYRDGAKVVYLPGLWKVQNAIVVARP